jgi:hypothetical protein
MAIFNRKHKDKADDPAPTSSEKVKFSKRPASKSLQGAWLNPDTAFKQQRLKAWQPILTPKAVLPTLFLIGIIFAPIGALIVWGSGKVTTITLDYTQCDVNAPTDGTFGAMTKSEYNCEYDIDLANTRRSLHLVPDIGLIYRRANLVFQQRYHPPSWSTG